MPFSPQTGWNLLERRSSDCSELLLLSFFQPLPFTPPFLHCTYISTFCLFFKFYTLFQIFSIYITFPQYAFHVPSVCTWHFHCVSQSLTFFLTILQDHTSTYIQGNPFCHNGFSSQQRLLNCFVLLWLLNAISYEYLDGAVPSSLQVCGFVHTLWGSFQNLSKAWLSLLIMGLSGQCLSHLPWRSRSLWVIS